MPKQFFCKDCHFFKDENPFEITCNDKFYPCTNIGADGWDYWAEHQKEPEHCEAYCKRGEYVPVGVWAGMAKLSERARKF